jgi:sugar phosphate isomerase/epimerase
VSQQSGTSAVNGTMPLAAANFGFFYRQSLSNSLRQIAEAGYELVELSCGAPHIDLSDLGPDQRRHLRRDLERHQLRCVSTNPVELNPISGNRALSNVTHAQYRAAIELSAELGADSVVVIAGRQNPLIPMPAASAKDLLAGQLERLATISQPLGVTLALESVPFGFLQSARAVSAFIRQSGIDGLGIALDCANSFFAGADPAEAARASGELTRLVHVSDSWSDRWAHTSVGRGAIDFGAFADALRAIAYSGTTVYELVDGEDPAPRLAEDRARLSDWGWQ